MASKLIVLAVVIALASGKAVKPSEKAVAGGACDPEECKEQGDCRHYLTCEDGVWKERECGKNLLWNREIDNGFGGSCDLINNLSEALISEYERDPECIAKCEWKQTEEQRCTGKYWYKEKFTRQTLTDRDHELECPKGLIWNQATLACDYCQNVQDAHGNKCCDGNDGGDGGNSGENGNSGEHGNSGENSNSNESGSNENSGEHENSGSQENSGEGDHHSGESTEAHA